MRAKSADNTGCCKGERRQWRKQRTEAGAAVAEYEGLLPPKHDAGTATRHYRAFWQRRCRAAAAGAVLKLSRKAGIVRCCPRQNKIGPCLGAAGADKFNDSNNSKMRKRKLYRSMGAVLAFSQVFSSSVRRGLSISYTWAWYAFSQLIWSRVSSSTMTGSVEMGTRVSGSNFSQ